MLKTLKIHEETYDTIKSIADADRRPFTTTLDIIVEYYKENVKCQKDIKQDVNVESVKPSVERM